MRIGVVTKTMPSAAILAPEPLTVLMMMRRVCCCMKWGCIGPSEQIQGDPLSLSRRPLAISPSLYPGRGSIHHAPEVALPGHELRIDLCTSVLSDRDTI